MTSFLITSKSKQDREQYAIELCNKNKIDRIDITILDKDTLIKKDKKKPVLSIGIDDIKELQGRIHLKPIKSLQKACVIQDAQLLTVEAQNALLKILEEPPVHTLILLTADGKEILLPTILSRCKIIELQSENKIPQAEKIKLSAQVEKLLSLTAGDSLVMAEILAKNKDNAAEWLEKMTLVLREKLLAAAEQGSEAEMKLLASLIQQFQMTLRTLKTTNINTRLTLENLFLFLIIE